MTSSEQPLKNYSVRFLGNVTIRAASEAEAKELFRLASLSAWRAGRRNLKVNAVCEDILASVEFEHIE